MRAIDRLLSPLVLVWVALGTAPTCAAGPFRSLPAHWVHDDQLEPLGPDFHFDDLYFSAPNDGWIVGNRYLLQISGGNPEVTFVHKPLETTFNVVRIIGRVDVWAGGAANGAAAMWRYANGWQPVELPAQFSGQIVDLEFESASNGLALGRTASPGERTSFLLQYDAGLWQVLPLPVLEGRGVQIEDLCLQKDEGWAVGSASSGPGGSHPLVLRYTGGQWREVPLPRIPGQYVGLEHIVCPARERAFAAGAVRRLPRIDTEVPILIEYDGDWRRIETPEAFIASDITAIAMADSALWVGICSERHASLYQYASASWTRIPAPAVAGSRNSGFCVERLQVVSGEAWAIANDIEGPGLMRGLLFHYSDGAWTNRNWNWNHWRDLWFRVFGQ
jgi:hypothetical protein